MTEPESHNAAEEEMSFITHLLELRDRLLRMVLSIIAIFVVLYFFSGELFFYISGPLLKYMPEGSQMSAVDVASPFLTPFKLSIVASIFLAMPYILYQLWSFVAPGLYQKERRMAAPLVVVSSALFYCGMAFAYYVVFPLVFIFLAGQALEGVAYIPDITRYLDFVLTLFFAFGVAFQVPIATILIVWTGMVTPKQLVEKRPYVIVGAFVVGMLLTPPDFISQTLLAVPMWILFELGVVFSRFYVPDRDEEADEDDRENTIASSAVMSSQVAPSHADDTDEEQHANDSGHQEYEPDDDEFKPLTEDEMDAEIDRIEAEMDELDAADDPAHAPDDTKKDK